MRLLAFVASSASLAVVLAAPHIERNNYPPSPSPTSDVSPSPQPSQPSSYPSPSPSQEPSGLGGDSTTVLTLAPTMSGETTAPTDTISLALLTPTASTLPPTLAPEQMTTATPTEAVTRVATTSGESVGFETVTMSPTTATEATPSPTRPAFKPGTNVYSDELVSGDSGNNTVRARQAAVDYQAALRTIKSQPEIRLIPESSCTYEWKSVLGSGGITALGEIWALPGYVWLVPEDVRQGQIGNCGLGASVMTLANFDKIKYLTLALYELPDRPNFGDKSLAVVFKNEGTNRIVLMDDALPSTTSFACWEYLGYQPVLDAVRADPVTGRYDPTNVFYMPLIEKAWAKYLNAYPQYRAGRSDNNPLFVGYAGTEGTPPHFALAALTGGNPHRADRDSGTSTNLSPQVPYQAKMIVAAFQCIYYKRPCVIGTPLANNLEVLGTPQAGGGIWIGGDPGAPLNSGLVSRLSDDPANPSFVAYDFHNLITKDGKQYSSTNIMVGGHAYAVDPLGSTWNPDLSKGRVRLMNPWGCNPKYGDRNNDGYCNVGPNSPNSITISLSLFINLAWTMYYVDELPAI